jgi:fumarate reductase subunit D
MNEWEAVSIILGNVLVPVGNTGHSMMTLCRIIKEVKSTCSKVILLGVVSIHIYNGAPRASPWSHSKRPFRANILHQRTNSPTGKPVVLLVLG